MTNTQNTSDYHIPKHIPESLVIDFDIYDTPEIMDNIQVGYEKLFRDAPDIFWTPRNGGHWIVKGFDRITEVVTDHETFTAVDKQIPRVENPPMQIPLTMDPPDNLPFRQALTPIFAPKPIKAMEDKIRSWAIKIIDDVIDKGECDFIEDVSSLFPVAIFMELMGLPFERLREFRTLADDFFKAIDDGDKLVELSHQIIAIFTQEIEKRKDSPSDDLINHLMNASINGRPITLEELQSMCLLLFLGGMDTVTNVLGFSFRHLAQDPELQQRLAADPSLIPKFVDEGIRHFGVINTPRGLAKDCNKWGIEFKKDEMVMCCLPMAGRDPRKNDNPNVFDIDRPKKNHLTFSTGPHLCVGHFLARSEINILTEEWVKRIPSFSLKPNSKQESRLGTVLALVDLPIVWTK